jgi:hypothetical protein
MMIAAGVASLLMTGAGPAYAAGGWVIQPTPSVTDGVLGSVSCTSASSCVAVGSQSLTSPLAEAWNGTSWSLLPSPGLSGNLYGISCVAADSCLVVGRQYTATGSIAPLSEVWNGTGWTAQSVPVPAGGEDAVLGAVSCLTASDCTAVGVYTDTATRTGATLAEYWDGSSWVIQPTPTPHAAGAYMGVSSVSCAAAGHCTAVGENTRGRGTTYYPLILRSDGTQWTLQNAKYPKALRGGWLNGVSCATVTTCIAVGMTGGDDGSNGVVAEQWNGTRWALLPDSALPSGTTGALDGVSCVTKDNCTAVGARSGIGGEPAFRPLAQHWNGTSWTLQDAVTPRGNLDVAGLSHVSCPSAADCTAVGDDNGPNGTASLAEQRQG